MTWTPEVQRLPPSLNPGRQASLQYAAGYPLVTG
jgi:hypothetical protein